MKQDVGFDSGSGLIQAVFTSAQLSKAEDPFHCTVFNPCSSEMAGCAEAGMRRESQRLYQKVLLQPQHAICPVVNSQYFLKYPMETTKNIKQKQRCKTRVVLQFREILDIFYLICKYMVHFSSQCFKFTIVIYLIIPYI